MSQQIYIPNNVYAVMVILMETEAPKTSIHTIVDNLTHNDLKSSFLDESICFNTDGKIIAFFLNFKFECLIQFENPGDCQVLTPRICFFF